MIYMAVSAADIQKYLGGMDYPAGKDKLVEHAKSKGADEELISVLNNLPDREYNSAADVSAELKEVMG